MASKKADADKIKAHAKALLDFGYPGEKGVTHIPVKMTKVQPAAEHVAGLAASRGKEVQDLRVRVKELEENEKFLRGVIDKRDARIAEMRRVLSVHEGYLDIMRTFNR